MTYYDEVTKDGPLAYWRMSDAPFDETISRYNLCTNPSLQTDAAGFSTQRYNSSVNNAAFAGTRQTDGGWAGTAYYRATATAAWSFKAWITCPAVAATAGKTYVLSVYVRANRARTVALNVESVRSTGSVVGLVVGTPVALVANTWTRLSQIHTVPDGGVSIRAVPIVETLNNADRIEVDGLLYEEGPDLKTWFDGTSASCVWLGTAGSSASRMDTVFTRRYMVDENGVYRGDYSASGVNYNVPSFPQGGDGASQFLAAGNATVVGGNDAWNLSTNTSGQWTIEFFAKIDNASGGSILETDKWKIATVGTNRIGYMAAGASDGWTVPVNWATGTYHYYVFTYNNGLFTIYVDGVDVLAFTDTNLDAVGSGSLRFAPGVTAVTLDEVAIYPTALNDGRVSAHWISTNDALGQIVTATYIEPRIVSLQLIKNANISQQLTVTVQYSGGGTATPMNVIWSTSDATVAPVSPTGVVRALKAGSAAVTVTLPELGATAFVGVSIQPADPLPSDAERALYRKDSEQFGYDADGNMLYTTEEYWEVDPGRLVLGEWVYDSPVSLATLAYNISTLAGREGIPVADGENIRVPTKAGRRWLPKTPDQRQLSLAMWAQGTTPEGNVPKDIYIRTQFWENYNKLKALFAVWDRQILLTRRMATRYGIQKMQTWVEPSGNMDLSPTGPMRATFTVDLIMNDPFWRGVEEKSDAVAVKNVGGLRRYPRTYHLEYGSLGATGIFTLNNTGTHDARLVAEVHGSVQNPYFFNMDTNEYLRLINDVDLNQGDVILVDFYNRSIELKGSGSRYWWLDRNTDWLVCRPGEQRLQFGHEGLEDEGYVIWRWEPSYL